MHFALLLVLPGFLSLVDGAGFMTIQFLRYNNQDSRCQDGTYCDTILFFNARESPCDPIFRLTADKNTPGGTNLFDYQQPNYYDNQDVIDFGSSFGTITNPVIIAMNFDDNPGSIQITVTVMDKDTTKNDLIDVFATAFTANGRDSRSITMASQPMGHTLSANYWYSCHANYYGGLCNTYCLAQNEAVNGHYTCDSNGQKVCLSGWIGPSTNCKTPHPCSTGVCLNGGTCNTQGEGYLCVCPTDFTGTNCQQFLNPCLYRNPCRNSAPCYLDASNQPKCRCPTQFSGSQCDQDVNECSAPTNPCSNSMLCINTYGGFTCNCTDRHFSGTLCEINVCNGTICLNNGTCTPGLDRLPRCVCLAGFTGANCQIDVDECASRPCRNGATCRDLVANFACDCPVGFVGPLCERNPDDCVGSPCLNRGNCTDGLANYTCSCPLGFAGLRCEQNVDDCLGLPCRNGGTCVDEVASFNCTCPLGFAGLQCEQNVDDCVRLPCRNGGTCVDGVASFNCTCPPGYSGATCERPPVAFNATWGPLIGASPKPGASSDGGVNVVTAAVPSSIGLLLLVGLVVFLGIWFRRNSEHAATGTDNISNETYGNLEDGNTQSVDRHGDDDYSKISDLSFESDVYHNDGGRANQAYSPELPPSDLQQQQEQVEQNPNNSTDA